MGQETVTNIASLNPLWPLDADGKSQGAAHFRGLKTAVQSLNASGGAAQVGVIQSAVGAYLRTLEAKVRDSISVKDFGAIGDGSTHPLSTRYATLGAAQAVYPFVTALTQEIDWAACQACVNHCGATKSVFTPDGTYLLQAPVVTTVGTNLIGESDAAMWLATGAWACFTIDSTSLDVQGGSVRKMRFAATVNTIGAVGINIIGAVNKFVAKWKFASLRFSGLYAGIKVLKGHNLSGGYYVSYFSVNQISDITVDEYGANFTQYGVLGDGANTLSLSGGVIRAQVSGIEIGDGSTGMGDILVSGIQFNFGVQSVKLWGSITANVYGANISVVGNQFDGGNTTCVWARNLTRFKLDQSNNFAVGIDNDIQNCSYSQMFRNPMKSSYGITKTGIGIGAAVDLFRLGPTAAGYHSARVDLTVIGFVAGVGQTTYYASFLINTNAGVPTIGSAINTGTLGPATMTFTASNVGNEVKFVLNQNSSSAGSEFNVHADIISDSHRCVLL